MADVGWMFRLGILASIHHILIWCNMLWERIQKGHGPDDFCGSVTLSDAILPSSWLSNFKFVTLLWSGPLTVYIGKQPITLRINFIETILYLLYR
jgi:hypothetical protein